MRFGLFYEHQLPRPWDAGAEHQLFQDALAQVELADRVGFQYVWAVEHHFLEEYSHSSAPEVFLAAASQRTKQIRLGHGILQTSPLYNHPARSAERLATLDLVSGGRVEFGSGESTTTMELGGFGIPLAEKQAQWSEGLEAVIRCLTEEPFTGMDGRWVRMPPRNVVPKPLQRPHPPLWVACSRRDTIVRAAESGLGALTFAFIDPEEARGWVQAYERHLARCRPVGLRVDPEIACVTPMMVHGDEREALRRGLEGETSSATRWPTTSSSVITSPVAPTSGATSTRSAARRATTLPWPSPSSSRSSALGSRPGTTPLCGARSARRRSSATTCAVTRRPASTS